MILKLASAHVVVQLDEGPLILVRVDQDGTDNIVSVENAPSHALRDAVCNAVVSAFEAFHEKPLVLPSLPSKGGNA